MSWFAFFLCFFAWFGIAPLMSVIREEFQLTAKQIGWCVTGSVTLTIFARLLFGSLCDCYGPRRTYAALLVFGALPVMAVGLANDFSTFLLCRVLIGAIGASFVITQYHTSQMFAGNCVGTANATTAGWGNMGGGVTQLAMPFVLYFFVSVLGLSTAAGWRLSMVMVGLACACTGVAYYLLTQDTPEGDSQSRLTKVDDDGPSESFWIACRDCRVWALFVAYAACFGIELTINNIAVLYFLDYFPTFQEMDATSALKTAGLVASLFGLMNLFARTLGGYFGDLFGRHWGLAGRTKWLFMTLFCEGLALMMFSQVTSLQMAIPMLLFFSLFVQMSEGATFAVVPFVNKKALGSVAGIVGAGGNAGAMLGGVLFAQGTIPWPTILLIMGITVTIASFVSFAVTFNAASERDARAEYEVVEERRAAIVFAATT